MIYWIKVNSDITWVNRSIVLWFSILFIVCESVTINDNNNNGLSMLGLPREYHCALNYNNALYILGGQNTILPSLSINITNISQMPSIQWINNSLPLQHQQKTPLLCTVTSYGQVILFNESSLQHSVLLDLNTFNWNNMSTIRRVSSTNLTFIFAVTMMDDDRIFLLSNNNNNPNITTSWILDASNVRLRWRLSQLSSSSSSSSTNNHNVIPPPPSINGGVQLITVSSWILYFHIDQSSSSSLSDFYDVNVYGFDRSSMAWIGNIFNFKSATNYIHTTLINSNTDYDTLLIVPTWIDKNLPLNHPDNQHHSLTDQGYWLLTISINTTEAQINWHPSSSNNTMFLVKGESMTKLSDTIIFYGGDGLNKTNQLDYSSMFRFWNITDQAFLPTPSWLAALMPSSSSPSSTPSSSMINENSNNNHTLIIILATLLGVFGIAFFILIGIFLWFINKKNKKSSSSTSSSMIHATDNDSPRQLRLEEGQVLMNHHQQEQEKEKKIQSHRISFLKKDNATIWSNQLQRALSNTFHQKRKSIINNNNNHHHISTAMPSSHPSENNENKNNDDDVMLSKSNQKTSQSSPSCPSNLTPSTSHNIIPSTNSNRNSMYETTSVKTSRFVERI